MYSFSMLGFADTVYATVQLATDDSTSTAAQNVSKGALEIAFDLGYRIPLFILLFILLVSVLVFLIMPFFRCFVLFVGTAVAFLLGRDPVMAVYWCLDMSDKPPGKEQSGEEEPGEERWFDRAMSAYQAASDRRMHRICEKMGLQSSRPPYYHLPRRRRLTILKAIVPLYWEFFTTVIAVFIKGADRKSKRQPLQETIKKAPRKTKEAVKEIAKDIVSEAKSKKIKRWSFEWWYEVIFAVMLGLSLLAYLAYLAFGW